MLGSSVEARVHRSDGVHAQHQGHVMPNMGSGFFLEPMFSRELGSGVVLSLDFLLYFELSCWVYFRGLFWIHHKMMRFLFQITAPLLSCQPISGLLKFTSQGNSMECPCSKIVKCFQDSICTIVELVCARVSKQQFSRHRESLLRYSLSYQKWNPLKSTFCWLMQNP
jgi:hypothetical protein